MRFTSLLRHAWVLGGVSAVLAAGMAEHAAAADASAASVFEKTLASFTRARPSVFPSPQKAAWEGRAVAVTSVRLAMPSVPSGDRLSSEQVAFLQKELKRELAQLGVASQNGAQQWIFQLVDSPKGVPRDKKDEGYALTVNAAGNVLAQAHTTRGLVYAYQTLRQLLVKKGGKTSLPVGVVSDWPDFPMRGFMNDVGRNFMPMEDVLKVVDFMASVKLNVYHFHFTEHPGWRLESKIFPELTAPGAAERNPGMFYTQEEFKKLVRYCRLRGVTLIPEMDMPGHSSAFRKAMNVERMDDEKAVSAMEKLIAELASLAPKEEMPYIHIGTDESHGKAEQVSKETLNRYFEAVVKAGRTPMRWQPGLHPDAKYKPIEQLWMGRQARHAWPDAGARYVDSQEDYLNHLDPFETAMTYYFKRQCCYRGAEGLGGFICSFPDSPMADIHNQLSHVPIFIGMATGGAALWNPDLKFTEKERQGSKVEPIPDDYFVYFSNLPKQGDPLLARFAAFEANLAAFRDRFAADVPFPYVSQSGTAWKIIGPFSHGGKTGTVFGPEEIAKTGKLQSQYAGPDGKPVKWLDGEFTGGTIIFKHYCNFPTLFNGGKMGAHAGPNSTFYATTCIYSPKNQKVPFWIGGHTWAASDWRSGTPSVPGKWFHADPKFWVNGEEIPAPEWETPNRGGALRDHNWANRPPVTIALKKGWNRVLVKSPCNNNSFRWMFTFQPVKVTENKGQTSYSEFPGLIFDPDPGKKGR